MLTFGYDLETTSPDPFEGKIITIQYRRESENHIFKTWDYHHSEKELILAFLRAWKEIPRRVGHGGDYFVTYNFRLDGPFLLARCLLNEISNDLEWRKHLWSSMIHGPAYLDLYQLLGDRLTPYEIWKQHFGCNPSRFKNSDIPEMYRNERYADIEEYVNDELISLEKIYNSVVKESFYSELGRLRNRLGKSEDTVF